MADIPYGGGTNVSIPPVLYGNVLQFPKRPAPREAVVEAMIRALAPAMERVQASGVMAGGEIPKSVVGKKVVELPRRIETTRSYPHAFGTDMIRYGAIAHGHGQFPIAQVAPFLHSEELARRLLLQEVLKKGRAGSD